MYYYVKADLSLITPGATKITVYEGSSKKAAQLASSQVSTWLKALNQHGAWLVVTQEHNHNGLSSSELNRTWDVRWVGPLNAFGIREEFLLFHGSQDDSGVSKITEWPPGQLVLDVIRSTIPAAWFDGFLSDVDPDLRHLQRGWLRSQRNSAA